MKLSFKKPKRCAECGSHHFVPIIFGMPSMELVEKADLGLVALGGCCVSDSDPSWRCLDCEQEYYRKGIRFDHSYVHLDFQFGWEGSQWQIITLNNQICYTPVGQQDWFIMPDMFLSFKPNKIVLSTLQAFFTDSKWKRYYDNEFVLDGIQWSIEFSAPNMMTKSGGSNKFPVDFPHLLQHLTMFKDDIEWLMLIKRIEKSI